MKYQFRIHKDKLYNDDFACEAVTNVLEAVFGKDSRHSWGRADQDGMITVTIDNAELGPDRHYQTIKKIQAQYNKN